MTFACIILAAGEGSRIGKCKAALPFGESGESLLSHLIGIYKDCEVNNIHVVTGNWKEETHIAAQNFSSMLKFVNNDNPELGMYSSVCTGVSSLDSDTKYFFVHPVDIPLVKRETILRMKRKIMNSKSHKTWIIPKCENMKGHPVLISSSLIPELLNWKGSFGLRGFLSSQEHIKEIEYVDDEGTIFDIDNEDDFSKFMRIVNYSKRT